MWCPLRTVSAFFQKHDGRLLTISNQLPFDDQKKLYFTIGSPRCILGGKNEQCLALLISNYENAFVITTGRVHSSRLTRRYNIMDATLEDAPPPGLFFADSDSDEDVKMNEPPIEVQAGSSSGQVAGDQLFLPDSDDEGLELQREILSKSNKRPKSEELPSDGEMLGVEDLPRPSSPTSSMSEFISISSDDSGGDKVEVKPPPTKKRRISPRPGPSTDAPMATDDVKFPAYIGEFLVVNAWSTASGKGYVKRNDSVKVTRDDDEESKASSSKSTKDKKAGNGKKSDTKKQVTLTSMLKTKPNNFKKKKKSDTIVRLVNQRGFGAWFAANSPHFNTHRFAPRVRSFTTRSCLVGFQAHRLG